MKAWVVIAACVSGVVIAALVCLYRLNDSKVNRRRRK